jgi:4-amino-4-deoxy-L-arabinose transferase-like glycosyltransferase
MRKLLNWSNLLLLGIVLLASFFRLYRISAFMTFLGDEGRDVLVVYNILHGDLTLLGPTASVGGFFLGPIYYYFMAPFLLLFNYNPVGPAVMVAIFGILTVLLIYKIGRELFGLSIALIASGLYSFSPLVVTYSRSSWNPNLMPFFSLLTLYVVYRAIKNNSMKLFALSGFLLGISIQLHYLTLFLGVTVFFFVALNQYILDKKDLIAKIIKKNLIIFLGFLVGWSPFLLFEIRHGFPNITSILNFVFRSSDSDRGSDFVVILGDVFFRIFGRLITNFPDPQTVALGAHPNMALWYYATFFFAVVCTLYLFKKLFRAYKSRSKDFTKLSMFACWLVFGIGLFGFYKESIYDYYFGFMFPLPFFMVGLFLTGIFKNKVGKVVSIVILLIIIWLNSFNLPHKAPANAQLNQIEEISKVVIEKAGSKPFNFALMTGGNSDHGYRYFFTLWGKEPTTIENEIVDPDRKTVEDQLLVVCERMPDCHPLGDSVWEVAGFGRAEIAGEWPVSVVKVFKLVRYEE